MASARSASLNGGLGLGAEPPAESSGRAHSGGQGAKRLKAFCQFSYKNMHRRRSSVIFFWGGGEIFARKICVKN